MLKLHFINVGDGDATLVEELGEGRAFRMLVDAGREDVGEAPGSLRGTAAAYLAELGITRLDALVVTHLHEDHFGGIAALPEGISVGTAYSGFFPCLPVASMVRTGAEEKTVRGLMDCLERWTACTEMLAARGCRLYQAEETALLALTPELEAELICDDPAAAASQRQVWGDMLAGRAADPDRVWWSSKFRNPGSLRLELRYAGRRIQLAGDCYGAVWEKHAVPCDIFKVPHHGDAKAVTPELARRLHPAHAVISCSSEYIARKDRPSLSTTAALEACGSRLWFTDSFRMPGRAAERWTSVKFVIEEDGTILPPEHEGRSPQSRREGAGRSI